MNETCRLREQATSESVPCDSEECVYWRVVEHIDVVGPRTGCAIQYFALLEGGAGIASWLLSVKSRLESGAAADNPLDSLLPDLYGETASDSTGA